MEEEILKPVINKSLIKKDDDTNQEKKKKKKKKKKKIKLSILKHILETDLIVIIVT